MIDAEPARQAAELIWRCREAGAVIAGLPVGLKPRSRADGYAIQAHYAELADSAVLGWKIAATSTAGQSHIGVDGPLAGRLLTRYVHSDGAELAFGRNRMAVAEAEFAFRMSRDLPPRPDPYSLDDVMAAVAGLYPAIEVPDSRFEPFERAGTAQLIADNACARDFILGPEMPALWRETDLAAHPVRLGKDSGAVHDGTGANVLGDPRVALVWIANELSRQDIVLAAGQIVTTGTCTIPLPIAPGDRVTADFGALGRVGLAFAPN